MTRKEAEDGFRQWLATRPACVQALAAEFPLGLAFNIHDRAMYLLGYTEDDSLIISDVNPTVDYEAARRKQEYLEARHVRDGEVDIILLRHQGDAQ